MLLLMPLRRKRRHSEIQREQVLQPRKRRKPPAFTENPRVDSCVSTTGISTRNEVAQIEASKCQNVDPVNHFESSNWIWDEETRQTLYNDQFWSFGNSLEMDAPSKNVLGSNEQFYFASQPLYPEYMHSSQMSTNDGDTIYWI